MVFSKLKNIAYSKKAGDANLKGLSIAADIFETDIAKVGNYYVSFQYGRKKCKNIFQFKD